MDQDDAGVGPASGPVAVGVRFRPAGKIYEFDPGPLILRRDDRVLVETERGPELGTIAVTARALSKPRVLQRVIKKADARDLGREDQNFQRERESISVKALRPLSVSVRCCCLPSCAARFACSRPRRRRLCSSRLR